jgi:Tol biopolymer transport system component
MIGSRAHRRLVAVLAAVLVSSFATADADAVRHLDAELASRTSGERGERANAGASEPSISADGRYVAFLTKASNLDPDDRDKARDVYVRDRQTDETTLVSRASGTEGEKASGSSFDPEISADGRFVVFGSHAPNLVPGVSVRPQIYVRDLMTDLTVLVSRGDGADGTPGDGGSDQPSISADGTRIAFTTDADNFDSVAADDNSDVYIRDIQASTTTLASQGPNGEASIYGSVEPSISAAGTQVAFTLSAGDLNHTDGVDTGDDVSSVWVRDIATQQTTLASRRTGPNGGFGGNNGDPAISGDGARVAFEADTAESFDPSSKGDVDVVLRDLETQTTRALDGGLNNGQPIESQQPSIDHDGRLSVFSVELQDDQFDATRAPLLYAANVKGGAKRLGTRSNRAERQTNPALAANGRWVAFESKVTRGSGGGRAEVVVAQVKRP